MTVKQLKKLLSKVPDNAIVYTADHDHSEWETNGMVLSVTYIENQKKEFPEGTYAREELNKDGQCFVIEKPYVVLKV